MFVLGLCGAIGSGKTYVLELFEKYGCAVISADKVYSNLCFGGSQMLYEIISAFGQSVIDNNGNLDRKSLSKIVFDDKHKLNLLNSITHPCVIKEILRRIDELNSSSYQIVVAEVPLMFESGFDNECDAIMSVICDRDVQIERIMKRDNCTEQEALKRIKSQHDVDFYKTHSDIVIINNHTDLSFNIKKIINEIREGKYDGKRNRTKTLL